ncbi:MAG: hypothetical protein K2J68_02745 [Treponemataceae bacterium]|nr:hypothetical protein [Treponemataceae bacterium]
MDAGAVEAAREAAVVEMTEKVELAKAGKEAADEARKAAEEAERKLAEEKAAAEEAARKLAAEKAALEEATKELKEEKEAFRKTLEEAMDDDEENASDESAEDSPSLVPAVENILKDEDGGRDFESQINLFKTLLALSESLPPKAKKEFMQSRERVTLEYLISTLEGEPGLLKTSSALRKSGALTDIASEEMPGEERPMGELLETVVGDMKSLSQDLEEKDLSIALGKLADGILEKE